MTIAIADADVRYRGWTRLIVGRFEIAGLGTVEREIEDHGNAVAVLPVDPVRRTAVLVRQFRAPAFYAAGVEETLEAIAGILDESDPSDGARREAAEEAGLTLGKLEEIGRTWASPGISTERITLFLAEYRGGRGGEWQVEAGVTAVEMPLGDLLHRAETGAILDLKTLTLTLSLRLRRPELFR